MTLRLSNLSIRTYPKKVSPLLGLKNRIGKKEGLDDPTIEEKEQRDCVGSKPSRWHPIGGHEESLVREMRGQKKSLSKGGGSSSIIEIRWVRDGGMLLPAYSQNQNRGGRSGV